MTDTLRQLLRLWGGLTTISIKKVLNGNSNGWIDLPDVLSGDNNIRLFQYIFDNFGDVYEEYIKYLSTSSKGDYIANKEEAKELLNLCNDPSRAILYIRSNNHHVYTLSYYLIHNRIIVPIKGKYE